VRVRAPLRRPVPAFAVLRGPVLSCVVMWGDVGCCGALWGAVGRCGMLLWVDIRYVTKCVVYLESSIDAKPAKAWGTRGRVRSV
jgi:hypothetical protein